MSNLGIVLAAVYDFTLAGLEGYLWFVFPAFISRTGLYLISGKTSVFLFETLLYIRLLQLKPGQALSVSLAANAASVIIGFLLL